MSKALLLAARDMASDARMAFPIRDRLGRLRFPGLDLGAPIRDENMIRLSGEKLTRADAIDALSAKVS